MSFILIVITHIFHNKILHHLSMTFVIFVLGIEYVLKCTKTATPYGMKLVWKLPGPSEMTFTIHLKDTKKARSGSFYFISVCLIVNYMCNYMYNDLSGGFNRIRRIGPQPCSFIILLSMTLSYFRLRYLTFDEPPLHS